jgi:hypothetical protein
MIRLRSATSRAPRGPRGMSRPVPAADRAGYKAPSAFERRVSGPAHGNDVLGCALGISSECNSGRRSGAGIAARQHRVGRAALLLRASVDAGTPDHRRALIMPTSPVFYRDFFWQCTNQFPCKSIKKFGIAPTARADISQSHLACQKLRAAVTVPFGPKFRAADGVTAPLATRYCITFRNFWCFIVIRRR